MEISHKKNEFFFGNIRMNMKSEMQTMKNEIVVRIMNCNDVSVITALSKVFDVLEAKPVEAKPVEAKPVEAKPVEAKPIVAEPIVAKPIVAEPIVAKPIVAKPIVAKPIVAEPIVRLPERVFVKKQKSVQFDKIPMSKEIVELHILLPYKPKNYTFEYLKPSDEIKLWQFNGKFKGGIDNATQWYAGVDGFCYVIIDDKLERFVLTSKYAKWGVYTSLGRNYPVNLDDHRVVMATLSEGFNKENGTLGKMPNNAEAFKPDAKFLFRNINEKLVAFHIIRNNGNFTDLIPCMDYTCYNMINGCLIQATDDYQNPIKWNPYEKCEIGK
jgi:hypothetical protein